MDLKELAKMITKTEKCKEFCFNYSELFLEIILNEILGETISVKEVDTISTILSLGER